MNFIIAPEPGELQRSLVFRVFVRKIIKPDETHPGLE